MPAIMWRPCGACSSALADDYVIATGESHSVREFLDLAACCDVDWKRHVETDPRYFRPTKWIS
jgi:GDP-D-mannose dehydratase